MAGAGGLKTVAYPELAPDRPGADDAAPRN